MRLTFTILLLSALFYTEIGYYLQFLVEQLELREAAHEAWLSRLPDNRLYSIALDDLNAAGKWQDEGRECWFKGHLYDVVREKAVGARTYAFCMDDEKEAALIEGTGAMVPHDIPSFPRKTGDFIISSYTNTVKQVFRTGRPAQSRSRKRLPEFYRKISPPPPWVSAHPFC